MLVAGDDAGRKTGVMALVGKLGFEPVCRPVEEQMCRF
jgi:predicted dinucleotide-binding enzyme